MTCACTMQFMHLNLAFALTHRSSPFSSLLWLNSSSRNLLIVSSAVASFPPTGGGRPLPSARSDGWVARLPSGGRGKAGQGGGRARAPVALQRYQIRSPPLGDHHRTHPCPTHTHTHRERNVAQGDGGPRGGAALPPALRHGLVPEERGRGPHRARLEQRGLQAHPAPRHQQGLADLSGSRPQVPKQQVAPRPSSRQDPRERVPGGRLRQGLRAVLSRGRRPQSVREEANERHPPQEREERDHHPQGARLLRSRHPPLRGLRGPELLLPRPEGGDLWRPVPRAPQGHDPSSDLERAVRL